MDCCEFREKYSDFADGLLEEEAELRARRHLGACAACRRFDSAFRRGVSALRDLPSVEVSRSFGERLRGQLRHELVVRALAVDPLSGAIAALLVLVTVGVVTWDLAELHTARRATPAVTTSAAPPVAQPVTAVPQFRDTIQARPELLHPFDPVLLISDTSPAADAGAARFDVPAVWGGR
ncbi:MAG TPA: zf-HC2 domain-containing protein [Gemmatimonadales bacterium]|nr:zf-HC2 domain-containing protein [Gemmatimonadales bacterium]